MKIKNILVPVDFSACSKNALKSAIEIAKKFNAKIHMVNAVHVNTPQPDFLGSGLVDAIMIDYENQVKENFEQLESEIIELQDVPHEADRFISYLTDAIFTETETKDIDLIVMGTRAHHDKLEHIIGTRASDIVESSKVPVIVIPENVTTFAPKNIGFATDLSEVKNHEKLKIVRVMAEMFHASIMVFDIRENPETLTAVDQKHMRDVTEFFQGLDCSGRTVQSKSIKDGIISFRESHNLDMLVMIPHHRSFFDRLFKSSITKNIAIDIDIPLLSFHE